MSKSDETRPGGQKASKFAADRMLGRLVKWLRVLGCDVIYGPHLTGHGLIRAARAEERMILTRDRHLKQKQPPAFIMIASDDYREQLRQVVQEFRLDVGAGLFTRCLKCNSLLQARAKEAVAKLVPPYVFSTEERFSWCSRCQRIYWPGTHQRNMIEALGKIAVP